MNAQEAYVVRDVGTQMAVTNACVTLVMSWRMSIHASVNLSTVQTFQNLDGEFNHL